MGNREESIPPPLCAHDLELAARYAERRAQELRDEAATAETHHAKRSILRDALEHEARATRYRLAAGTKQQKYRIKRGDAEAALDMLREYLHTTDDANLHPILRELQRIPIELAAARDRTNAA